MWTLLAIWRAGHESTACRSDTLVVFGALVGPSGACHALQERVKRAAAIMCSVGADRIVCCGTPAETKAMRALLVEHGIPTSVLVSQDAVSTRAAIASLTRSSAVHWGDITVVSSPYHMRRILSEARRHGISVAPAPSRIDWSRASGSLCQWRFFGGLGRQYLREVIASWWYTLTWPVARKQDLARASSD
ncbi:MAG: YdcF family protein [Nitrososphaerales archaeon]